MNKLVKLTSYIVPKCAGMFNMSVEQQYVVLWLKFREALKELQLNNKKTVKNNLNYHYL